MNDPEPIRRLEGPGSEARARNLRQRFAGVSRGISFIKWRRDARWFALCFVIVLVLLFLAERFGLFG